LQILLGKEGELDDLRWALVNNLREDLQLDASGLAAHLRQSVAGHLFIDQPGYSALTMA